MSDKSEYLIVVRSSGTMQSVRANRLETATAISAWIRDTDKDALVRVFPDPPKIGQ